MAPSRFNFDYTPLNRTTSFTLLLLILFTISTSLNLLIKFVGIDGSCQGESVLTPVDYINTKRAGAPTCKPEDTHELVFSTEDQWIGWNDNVTKTWRELVPENSGLGQDDNFNNGIPYGIAIFHQLHCLYAIREHLTVLMLEEHPELVKLIRGKKQQAHMNHCFDWLRQSLLCHADDTREHMVPMSDGTFSDQTVRVCGNSQKLYEATKNPKAQEENIVMRR